MSSASDDPPRSIDDPGTPAALRLALVAGRADVPDHDALTRMAARLGCAEPAAQASDAREPAPRHGWIRRTAVPSIAALCALGGWAAISAREARPARQLNRQEQRSAVAAPAAAVKAPTAVPAAPIAPAAPPATAQDVLPARAPARVVRSHAAPSAASASSEAADPAAELALLRRAQAELTPAPSRALALAEQHAQQYPHGVFQEERELIAVIALLGRGELSAAQARAARFERSYPSSVHTARLHALLADHKNGALGAPIVQSATSRRSAGE